MSENCCLEGAFSFFLGEPRSFWAVPGEVVTVSTGGKLLCRGSAPHFIFSSGPPLDSSLARQFSYSAVPQPHCGVFAMAWDWGALGKHMGYRVLGPLMQEQDQSGCLDSPNVCLW